MHIISKMQPMPHRKYCPTCPGREQSFKSWQIAAQSLAKSTQVPWLPPAPGAAAAGVTDGPAELGIGIGIGIVIVMLGVDSDAGDDGTVLVPGGDGDDTPGVATGNPLGTAGDDSVGDPPVGVGGRESGGEFVGTSEA